MELVTRTIYGSRLQSIKHSGLVFTTDQNTTLNEKFEILAGITPAADVYPSAEYFAVGNGGHELATGTGGIGLTVAKQHLVTDAALYSHIPFVLRATGNDISNTEQQKYALRKPIVVGGQNYIAYYLKRIPTDGVTVTTLINTVVGGVTTSAAFVPGPSNLSPVAPVLTPEMVNLLDGQYATVSATLPLVFTADECTELLNAAEIIWGDPAYAVISEIAIVAATDYPITLPNGSTMNEAIAAQCTTFVNTMHVVSASPSGINGSFDVGSNEPMLILTAI